MAILVIGPFISPLRVALIKFFRDIDTAELYVDMLKDREANRPWPTELTGIYLIMMRNVVGYFFMLLFSFFVALFWPVVWIAAGIGLFAVIAWLIKMKSLVSTKE